MGYACRIDYVESRLCMIIKLLNAVVHAERSVG